MLKRIIDGLELNARHTRSISLSRDLKDQTIVSSYLPTPNALHALKQIGSALAEGQPQRAWKVIGPYGSGKSALAIVLAQLFAGREAYPSTWTILNKASAPVAELFVDSRRFTLAIVGARLSIGAALGVEILRALAEWPQGKGVATLRRHLSEPGLYKGRPINAVAGELMRDFASATRTQGFVGTLLLIDEVGKFIEHAALHPEAGDLIALQQLAEEACQHVDDSFAMVVFQHQHFASYAAGIGRSLADEWHKVASRFEEIPFDEPVERYAHFAANALASKPILYRNADLIEAARALFRSALEQSTIRASTAADRSLFQHAEKLYPLHPLTLASLAVISKRHGQSERSFHAFLNSREPAGLRDFAEKTAIDEYPWYRLTQMFDYLASGHGLRFRELAAERRWAFALTCIERQAKDTDVLSVLKTVAVLELVHVPLALCITPALVAFALGETDIARTRSLLDGLVDQGLLTVRHSRSEYAFAVSEAVNIEALYDQVIQAGENELAVQGASHALATRVVVANKHYDQRGTIRTLGINVGTVAAWPQTKGSSVDKHVDARLCLVLVAAGSPEEEQALDRIRTFDDPLCLHTCLSLSAEGRAALSELAIWTTVQREVAVKRLDPWTSHYVEGRLHQSKEDVDALVFSALTPSPGGTGSVYWYQGTAVPGSESMNVSQVASWLFEKVFHSAPRIVNELINKDRPASAIVLARQRLLDALLVGGGSAPLFGDNEYPPERLIHATLLRDTGIWEIEGEGWKLTEPKIGVSVDIRSVWSEISRVLVSEEAPTFEQVVQALAAPPFGVRSGPASIWVTLYLMINRSRCAVFERGSLVLEFTSEHLQRMHRNPQTFTLRELSATSGRKKLLHEYSAVLASLGATPNGDMSYLEVARTLYRWFGKLSDFTQQTGRVSKEAALIRSILRKAQDPILLLTSTLPRAHEQSKDGASFLEWLNGALTDLAMSQRKLQETVVIELGQGFEIVGSLAKVRIQLQGECSGAVTGLADARLKSFILRCTDLSLTDEKWLDSVASLLVQRPLDSWTDETIASFAQAVTEIAGQYRRWIRLVMQRKGAPRAAERFLSLTLTDVGGRESAMLVTATERSTQLAQNLVQMLMQAESTDTRTATAALAQALQQLQMKASTNSIEEVGHGKLEAS